MNFLGAVWEWERTSLGERGQQFPAFAFVEGSLLFFLLWIARSQKSSESGRFGLLHWWFGGKDLLRFLGFFLPFPYPLLRSIPHDTNSAFPSSSISTFALSPPIGFWEFEQGRERQNDGNTPTPKKWFISNGYLSHHKWWIDLGWAEYRAETGLSQPKKISTDWHWNQLFFEK